MVGLTGGIASGKSTVSNMFVDAGAYLIDADIVSRQVYGRPEVQAEIREAFGDKVHGTPDDRKAIAEAIFKDPKLLKKMAVIMDERIRTESMRQIEKLAVEHYYKYPVIIYDAALLVEKKFYRDFDRLIVVGCDKATQISRLMSRNKLTEDEAMVRIAAQLPLEDKKAVADFYIDTNGSLHDVSVQVLTVYEKIRFSRRR